MCVCVCVCLYIHSYIIVYIHTLIEKHMGLINRSNH